MCGDKNLQTLQQSRHYTPTRNSVDTKKDDCICQQRMIDADWEGSVLFIRPWMLLFANIRCVWQLCRDRDIVANCGSRMAMDRIHILSWWSYVFGVLSSQGGSQDGLAWQRHEYPRWKTQGAQAQGFTEIWMNLRSCPLKVVLKMVLRGRAMNIRGEKRRERKLRVLAKCKNGLEVTLRDYICLPYFLPSFFSCDCRSDASYDHVCEGSLQDFFFISGWHR